MPPVLVPELPGAEPPVEVPEPGVPVCDAAEFVELGVPVVELWLPEPPAELEAGVPEFWS